MLGRIILSSYEPQLEVKLSALCHKTADPPHAPSPTYDWDSAKLDFSFQMWRVGVGLKFN